MRDFLACDSACRSTESFVFRLDGNDSIAIISLLPPPSHFLILIGIVFLLFSFLYIVDIKLMERRHHRGRVCLFLRVIRCT